MTPPPADGSHERDGGTTHPIGTGRVPWGTVPEVVVSHERPAATVVLLRGDPLQVLLLRRSSKVAFGGMWVFPGGRVDPADADPQRPGDLVASARRAAAREAAEEAALVVAPDDLVPFALWVPPVQAPRRYRTWFFVAAAPASSVAVDGGEIEDHAWLTPQEALDRHSAGVIELAPPTWITLWQLAGEWAGTVEHVLARLTARPMEEFHTEIVADGEEMLARWEGDASYGGGDLHLPGHRRRLRMGAGRWHVEWSTPDGSGTATAP